VREAGSGIDEAVSLSFEKARQVPAEMREEISAPGGAGRRFRRGTRTSWERITGRWGAARSDDVRGGMRSGEEGVLANEGAADKMPRPDSRRE
jgi:hypothetical protein